MRTRRTILGIVVAVAALAAAAAAGLMVVLGPGPGLALAAVAAAVVISAYGPVADWHHRWGATDQEAGGAPGHAR